MPHHRKETMDNIKQEYAKLQNEPLPHTDLLLKKDYIFVIAKTWGAAVYFYNKTVLKLIDEKYSQKKIIFLSNESQIKHYMVPDNTLVIVLSRWDENSENKKLMNICKLKEYQMVHYSSV